MAIGRALHLVGVVFVITAFALLLVTCIGAPAVNDIGLLKIHLNNGSNVRHSSVVFGPFGYCVVDVAAPQGKDYCPRASVGYIPAQVMKLADPATTWTTWGGHHLDLMTEAYILFPIALALALLTAVFAFCGVIGSVIAAFLCALGWVAALAVVIIAFISMGRLKHHVKSSGGLHASYGVGMWTALAAMILLFLAIPFLFFSCCSGLRGKRRQRQKYNNNNKQLENSEFGRDSRSYEAERDPTVHSHHDRGQIPVTAAAVPSTANGRQNYETGYAPAGAARVPFTPTGRQQHLRDTIRDKDYENGNLGGNHHNAGYAPVAVGGAIGGAVAAAPREHQTRNPLGEDRRFEGPGSLGDNQQYPPTRDITSTPVHALTTHQDGRAPSYLSNPAVLTHNLPRDGNTITHHHPTTTTMTSTYHDGRGGFNTDMDTRTHQPQHF